MCGGRRVGNERNGKEARLAGLGLQILKALLLVTAENLVIGGRFKLQSQTFFFFFRKMNV